MSRSGRDTAYLGGVLESWRAAFADAEGDNLPELYRAAAARARAGDWTQLRPLLAVLRTILRSNNTLTTRLSTALRDPTEPVADEATGGELWALPEHLPAALNPLQAVLAATKPDDVDDPQWLGAGRPPRPLRVVDPGDGRVAGLLAIPPLGAGMRLWSLGMGAATVARESQVWWRGLRARVGLDQPPPAA